MAPPAIFVMSTRAVGPRDRRRPAGVIHAAPDITPPVNQTFCGLVSLFWFGDLDFESLDMAGVDGRRCATCVAAVAASGGGARGGRRDDPVTGR